MNLPHGRRGQLTAIGLLLLLLLLVFDILLQPIWQHYRTLHQDISDSQAQLIRLSRIAAQLPSLEQRYQQFTEQQPLAPYLLEGDNRALAGAALQRLLQDAVMGQQGRILSAQVLNPVNQGSLQRIALNARLQIDLPGLQRLLYQLENSQPLLRVTQWNVTSRNRGREAELLDVRLTLDGLQQAPSPEAQDG